MKASTISILMLTLVLAGCATTPKPVGQPTAAERIEAPVAAPPPRRVDADAQYCLALAMYWEARGEGRHGMEAVGSVVMNRVADPRFPNTVCGVVHEGGEKPPCQFSWWCDGKSDRPTQQRAWEQSRQVARDMLLTRSQDPTHGALFFHNTSIGKPWRRTRTAQIGNHIFYK